MKCVIFWPIVYSDRDDDLTTYSDRLYRIGSTDSSNSLNGINGTDCTDGSVYRQLSEPEKTVQLGHSTNEPKDADPADIEA